MARASGTEHPSPSSRFASAVSEAFWFLATEMVILSGAMVCWYLLYSLFDGLGKYYPQIKEKWFFSASMGLSQVVLFGGIVAHSIVQLTHSLKEVVGTVRKAVKGEEAASPLPKPGRRR